MVGHQKEQGFCERCDNERTLLVPWRGWRGLRRMWIGVLVVTLALSPFWIWDYVVMTPGVMMMMAAMGPLNGFASEVPSCLTCGAEVPHGGAG